MFKVKNKKVTIKSTVNCSSKLVNKFKQNLHFFFSVFIVVLDKRVNILCSIASISRATMIMMMMMMTCFCGMVDQRKAFRLVSSRDHCQRPSPSRISDTPRAGFEPAENLSSNLVKGTLMQI